MQISKKVTKRRVPVEAWPQRWGKCRTISVSISEKAFSHIESDLKMKAFLGFGETMNAGEMFAARIVKSIEEGKTEISIRTRVEREEELRNKKDTNE